MICEKTSIKNNNEKDHSNRVMFPDSAKNNLATSQSNAKYKKNLITNLKNKQQSHKKSLSDGEVDTVKNEKADNNYNKVITLKEQKKNSVNKNLNNLSNLKNKPINNLTKLPDNFTATNYFLDNNTNKDYYKQQTNSSTNLNMIAVTPTFMRNEKVVEQNNKAKGNLKNF